jgi:predicted ferric reductase
MQQNKPTSKKAFPQALSTLLTLTVAILALTVGLFTIQSGTPLAGVRALFALDSVQTWWYVTRAAGLLGYLLMWLSTLWGLAVSSKIFDPWLERLFTFDFHEHLSLLGLGFVTLHVVVLLLDQFQPFSIFQVLFPFISAYRPLWVGIGILTFYLSLLVTITFYMRARISQKTFRTIHYLSLAAYLGATLHGLFAGTDTPLMAVGFMYLFTFLIIIFLCAYWLYLLVARNREEKEQARLAARQYRYGKKTQAPSRSSKRAFR